MTINRCTVVILSFISFALLVAGTALTSDNRPLWPGFICFGAMLLCVVIAWLVDDEAELGRRRAYRRLQRDRARERACERHCPDCRVIVFGDTTERVPCQRHADPRSVAIERQAL